MDMARWPCKCQWGCGGGNECHGNQTFEKRLKERCDFCKESCKNCVVIEHCDSASCKGRCRFHGSWDEEMAEVVTNEAPVRPVTPERETSPMPARPTPSRSTHVEDSPLRRLVLDPRAHNSSRSQQASPCPEEVMTNTEEEAEADPPREGTSTPAPAAQTVSQEEPPHAEPNTEKEGQASHDPGVTRGSKPSALLKSLLNIQENKEKTRLRREAVLKTFAERLANDFQNMERLTQLSLGGTIRRVFAIVSDAVNQVAPAEGAGQTTGKKSEIRGGTGPQEATKERETWSQQRQPAQNQQQGKAPRDAGPTPKDGKIGIQKKENKQAEDTVTQVRPLWTQVLKKDFRPQNQEEERKAARGVMTKEVTRHDSRVFLRFSGQRPDEVVTEHAVRACLTAEENKGVVRANQTRNAIALLVKTKQDVANLLTKQELIKQATGADRVESSEKWNKFIFRGVTRLRLVKGSWAALNEADVRFEITKNQGTTDLKKILVIQLTGCAEKCNVIVFTGEDDEIKRSTTLFGDRVGAVKITDKPGPRFCRNCKMHHVGLCRKENKCENCGKAEHGKCEEKTRCTACHQDHKSSDPKCPLRPRRAGNQWLYPNEWIIQAKRKQTRADLKAKAKKDEEKEAEKTDPKGTKSSKGKGPAEWS